MLCYFTYLSFLFIYLFICLLIYVMLFYRRGHPGSAVFHCILQPLTLHMCHGSLTALGFLQWLNKTKIKKKNKKKKLTNRRDDHGGEGVHIVETRMFCTVCLKSSCLLICVHSWSLDLSQTLIQTIQILKEAKTGPKPWKNKKTPPRHLSSFSSDPLMGRNFLFFFIFLFSRGFCHLGPKMPQNPWKKQKNKISFGGIPNNRNVLFLQIFSKRAAKPSAGKTSAGFPWIKWTWPGLASATFSGTR